MSPPDATEAIDPEFELDEHEARALLREHGFSSSSITDILGKCEAMAQRRRDRVERYWAAGKRRLALALTTSDVPSLPSPNVPCAHTPATLLPRCLSPPSHPPSMPLYPVPVPRGEEDKDEPDGSLNSCSLWKERHTRLTAAPCRTSSGLQCPLTYHAGLDVSCVIVGDIRLVMC